MPLDAVEGSRSESALVGRGATASWKVATLLLLLILGFLEGWFTRTDFATDAISYLDISRALPAGNWKLVFNPLWSVGYPFLLSITRPFFPKTPGGEWLAIHALNVLIFLATWIAFNYLLESPLLEDAAEPGKKNGRNWHFSDLPHSSFSSLFNSASIQYPGLVRICW